MPRRPALMMATSSRGSARTIFSASSTAAPTPSAPHSSSELTWVAAIQLNERVSLRRTNENLSLPQSRKIGCGPRTSQPCDLRDQGSLPFASRQRPRPNLPTVNPLSFARERLTQPLRESWIGHHFGGGWGCAYQYSLFWSQVVLVLCRAQQKLHFVSSAETVHLD